MKLYTIGFIKKTAEQFFSLLKSHKIDTLIDIRLKPDSQLSGFAKSRDLPYFLSNLANMKYIHIAELAPSDELLSKYRKDKDWDSYEKKFEMLMDERNIPTHNQYDVLKKSIVCLLCSEHLPEKCHRRLVAERWGKFMGNIEIVHLI